MPSPDFEAETERLAESMWRVWVADNGGDTKIPWAHVATKVWWQHVARLAIVARAEIEGGNPTAFGLALGSPDHEKAMVFFDRQFPHLRLDKEPRALWAKGHVYQSGEANQLFLAFRHGVAYGKALAAGGS